MEGKIKKAEPIFIYGVLGRSGTNFLNGAILLHRNCVQPKIKVRENYFVDRSDFLWRYTSNLFDAWSNPEWGGEKFEKTYLFQRLGDALLSFIAENCLESEDSVLVTKTPSVRNIQRTFKLFPSTKILIIVRDPRDIAASAYRSWERSVENSIHSWNEASRTIADFEKVADPEKNFLMRYEDLIAEPNDLIRQILAFLALDDEGYAWDRLTELPILGSSDYKGWQIRSKGNFFKTSGKWESLPKSEQDSFTFAHKKLLTYFGYPLEPGGAVAALPSRNDRLDMDISLETDVLKPTHSNLLDSLRERFLLGKRGARMMADAISGAKVVNFIMGKIVRRVLRA